MPHSTVTGIVIRAVNYKDNDRMLTLFTRELGRVDACARGCRRAKSPLLPASEPFVYGEFQLFAGRGERYSVDQCDVRESFFRIREDVERLTAGSCMLALAQDAIQPSQPDERLFSLLYHALSFLCYGDSPPVDMALCYILRYLDAIGFCPAITACAVCSKPLTAERNIRFSPESGGAVCPGCAPGARPVRVLTLEAMRRMLLLSDGELGKVRLPPAVREELFGLLTDCCKQVCEREHKPILLLRQLMKAGDGS